MRKSTYKTNKRDFRYFKRRCLYWADRFGLGHWEFRFQHVDDGGALATVQRDAEDGIALINFARDWGERKPTKVRIDKAALDEIGHCLLHDLTILAGCFDKDYVAERTHRIIRRITHALRDEMGK